MKSLRALLILALCLSFTLVSAQTAPEIQWQNSIGGRNEDNLYAVTQTTDGGSLLGCWSISGISGDKTEAKHGANDYWVVKLDGSGNIEWQNTIGGNDEDFLLSVIQTIDGGYLLGGASYSGISGDKNEASQGDNDFWVVKLDITGSIEWQNTIGGNSEDVLVSCIQTTDSGYLLGGYSLSDLSGDKTEASQGGYDYWVVKLNSSGTISWQNTIGGDNFDWQNSVVETSDDGYLVGGNTWSGISGDLTEASLGISDYWILKLNSSGNIIWQNTIGGNENDLLNSIVSTNDGGSLLAGISYSGISGDKTEINQGVYDYWVVKLNDLGNIEWQNTIGGSENDFLYSVIQDNDGGYLLGGHSESGISGDKNEASQGESDYWVLKFSSLGNIEWQNTIGGNSDDYFSSVTQASDGSYLLGGYSDSEISGDKTEESEGEMDYWVVKLLAVATGELPVPTSFEDSFVELYPNPVQNQLTINLAFKASEVTISVYDLQGKIIELPTTIQEMQVEINTTRLANGFYTLHVINNKTGTSEVRKFVK